MTIARRKLLFGASALALVAATQANATNTNFEATLFKSTSGNTARDEADRWNDWFNVKDFGAKGDGSTDDTTAIQSAITAIAATTLKSGRLYFPQSSGAYVISACINLSSLNEITIEGDGYGSFVSGNFGPTTHASTSYSGTPSTVTWNSHGLTAGEEVVIGGAAYFVAAANLTTNTFQVTGQIGGSTVTISASSPQTVTVIRTGYLFGNIPSLSSGNGPGLIRNMRMTNSSVAAMSGCIFPGGMPLHVDKCALTGFNVLDFSNGAGGGTVSSSVNTASMVSFTQFRCSAAATVSGSFGVSLANAQGAFGCDFEGFAHAIRHEGTGGNIEACRIEVSQIAIALGVDDFGNSNVSTGVAISGGSMEANDKGIVNVGGANQIAISGVSILGESGAPSGDSAVGIDIGTGSCTCTGVICNGVNSSWTTAGITQGQGNSTFISTTVNGNNKWVGGAGSTYINCNQPITINTVAFASLPSTPWVGQRMYVSDSTTNTFAATVAGGGANHVIAEWNNTHWIVVGVY